MWHCEIHCNFSFKRTVIVTIQFCIVLFVRMMHFELTLTVLAKPHGMLNYSWLFVRLSPAASWPPRKPWWEGELLCACVAQWGKFNCILESVQLCGTKFSCVVKSMIAFMCTYCVNIWIHNVSCKFESFGFVLKYCNILLPRRESLP